MTDRPRLTAHDVALRLQRAEERLLLADPKFLKFISRLFSEAGMFDPNHRANPHDTSYFEGRRALGLEVLHRLKQVRPDVLALVEAEAAKAAIPQEQDEDDD